MANEWERNPLLNFRFSLLGTYSRLTPGNEVSEAVLVHPFYFFNVTSVFINYKGTCKRTKNKIRPTILTYFLLNKCLARFLK